MERTRKILHVDMDAFYASIEQRDDPSLRGRPVVVGGSPRGRGVVCTASYEARVFGVHSAMPCAWVPRLCPDAVFVAPRFEVYKAVSRQIHAIFHDVTDLVEPLSLDEAYLDVTHNHLGTPSGTRVAQEIRRRIQRETGLTASAGVAPNKFLAKLASEMDKPDGLTVIPPERVEEVLCELPVRRIHGIGRATEARMDAVGIRTVKDLRRWGERALVERFGRAGKWYHALAFGRDDREVCPHHERRSLGAERTFETDWTDLGRLERELALLAETVAQRLDRARFFGRTVTLKVTWRGFERITRSATVLEPPRDGAALFVAARALLQSTEAGRRPVRLLGISVSNPVEEGARGPVQLALPFGGEEAGDELHAARWRLAG